MSRMYLKQNVLDAALGRVARIFDEFPAVVVNFSGGKDSTVLLNLALRVAEEKGRLPLNVLWIDQEAEWQHVVDYVRTVMNDPRVKPYWFQGPFRITNATTTGEDPWLHCWREGDTWIRPKEPNSIHENRLGVDRFKDMFVAFGMHYFGHVRMANLGGVRCEESPARMNGLTCHATYRDITWGKKENVAHGHYTFYPLYDWSYVDVWKAIHDHGWRYCRLYDFMYQYGVHARDMRVSNVHHETSIESLRFLQEVEPDTWDRIVERVGGANAVSQMRDAYRPPRELPPMFASWREYRDYLVENLIAVEDVRGKFRHLFKVMDQQFRVEEPAVEAAVVKMQLAAVMVNDYEQTKLKTFYAANGRLMRGHRSRAGTDAMAGRRSDGVSD